MSKDDSFDVQDFLPYLLNQAAEEGSLGFQTVYKERYGLLRTEWRVLFHLGIYGQMTATEIGTRARIHKTKVSRAVQKLNDRRFVERSRSDSDRRVEWLHLTAAGMSAYNDLSAIAQSYDAALQARFCEADIVVFKRVLRHLARLD